MTWTALVPIADGTEEIEAVCLIDTLRRAGIAVTVASVEESLQITASRKTKLVADIKIQEAVNNEYDLIALPGGMPGAEHLRDSSHLTQILKKHWEKKKLYAAICASPVVVLQTHGLLQNREATCHPSMAKKLENQKKANCRVVVDGNCVTSQAPGTALEFSIKLIEILCGHAKAEEVAKPMLISIGS